MSENGQRKVNNIRIILSKRMFKNENQFPVLLNARKCRPYFNAPFN
jgi:hypothetical protein